MATVATAHTGGLWLVASKLLGYPVGGMPYPCLCEVEDPDPPQWKKERAKRTGDGKVFRCDPWQVKGTTEWRNRCSCWGQPVDDKPEGCCAHHERNPRYYVIIQGIDITAGAEDHSTPDEKAPPPLDDDHPEWAGSKTEPQPPSPTPLDDDYSEWADTTSAPDEKEPTPDYLGHVLGLPPEDLPPERHTRRWSAEEITCPCRTPWDGLKKGLGFHCSADGCHRNFRNVGVAQMHGGWLKPCKDPASIVDMGPGPTTGTPLLRLSYADSGAEVWG